MVNGEKFEYKNTHTPADFCFDFFFTVLAHSNHRTHISYGFQSMSVLLFFFFFSSNWLQSVIAVDESWLPMSIKQVSCHSGPRQIVDNTRQGTARAQRYGFKKARILGMDKKIQENCKTPLNLKYVHVKNT